MVVLPKRCPVCDRISVYEGVACTACINEASEAIEVFSEDDLERWAQERATAAPPEPEVTMSRLAPAVTEDSKDEIR